MLAASKINDTHNNPIIDIIYYPNHRVLHTVSIRYIWMFIMAISVAWINTVQFNSIFP